MKIGSLNFKVTSIIAILVTGSMLIVFIGLSKMGELKESLNMIVNVQSARVSTAKQLQSVFYVQMSNLRSYILEDDKAEHENLNLLMEKRNEQMLKLVQTLYDISTEVGRKEMTEYKDTYGKWWELSKEVREVSNKGREFDAAAYKLLGSKGGELKKSIENILTGLIDRNEANMAKEVTLADEQYQKARMTMILVSVFATLLGIGIATVVLRKLSKSINSVIENLDDNSQQVTQAAQQIANASVELSQATTEQASSLEETVATLEELTSMVRVNSNNAGEAAKLSGSASTVASQGEERMKTLIDSMQEISADSKKIEEIISVIDDIAFQTNLLALNAAVEAARAGEQGKGFAVVADAVRTLAQKSAEAAKDINNLIKSSVHKIERGSIEADASGQVLTEILSAVKKMEELNREIASASEEQSNGIAQISKAMNQLDQTTQVNAASSEEAAASAEELSAQADSLSRMVVQLIETVHGTKEAPRSNEKIADYKSELQAA
ncbi:methyl-accepting chemotaxis protein [Bdellovibrio sp. NC01]|uniref:methyl-accepting chemotaxis protein n=1 Tax=Bdellovibrio sp. NC01 TaxID=2220073 RepID=UPI001158ADEC|nr:methyl-accepting chemotaxis protein [Bdellovibrio sp. NC01]QDK37373.1 chemotaxis protein [Bdellovibrio sp. NC01]